LNDFVSTRRVLRLKDELKRQHVSITATLSFYNVVWQLYLG